MQVVREERRVVLDIWRERNKYAERERVGVGTELREE